MSSNLHDNYHTFNLPTQNTHLSVTYIEGTPSFHMLSLHINRSTRSRSHIRRTILSISPDGAIQNDLVADLEPQTTSPKATWIWSGSAAAAEVFWGVEVAKHVATTVAYKSRKNMIFRCRCFSRQKWWKWLRGFWTRWKSPNTSPQPLPMKVDKCEKIKGLPWRLSCIKLAKTVNLLKWVYSVGQRTLSW